MQNHTPTTPRYDAVDGRAPSAQANRIGMILPIAGLGITAIAILTLSVVLCVVAGFGIELFVGVFVAMLGTAPILLAALSRRPQPVLAQNS